jgi:CMP-N-acetylneuraminic acid synthetase
MFAGEGCIMIGEKKILAVIPARGGSKGLPGKNIKPLLGKPLIAWTIEQAKVSNYLDRVIVSTDDETIADIARQWDGDVPFLRPKELAGDASPIADTILHLLDRLEQDHEIYDYIALLEPTSPLRKPDDIDNALGLLAENEDADSLVSVGEVHMEHPMIVKRISEGLVIPYMPNIEQIYQRQQADKAYFPYGVVYVSKVCVFRKEQTFYTKKTIPYFIERWQNYEIDDIYDFMCVETILKHILEVKNG